MDIEDPHLRDHVYTIGLISLTTSFAELNINNLVELYIGEESGKLVLSELGANKSKVDFLRKLVLALEKDKPLKASILNSLDVFRILKENRNLLMHSYSLEVDEDGAIIWHRVTQSANLPIAATFASLEDLRQLCKEMKQVSGNLSFQFEKKAQDSGYRIFAGNVMLAGPPEALPLPRKWKDVPPQVLASTLRQLERR